MIVSTSATPITEKPRVIFSGERTTNSEAQGAAGLFIKIPMEKIEIDTHNAYDKTSMTYTVPETGMYQVNVSLQMYDPSDVDSRLVARLRLNDTSTKLWASATRVGDTNNVSASGSRAIMLNKADKLTIDASNSTGTFIINTTSSFSIYSV